MKEYVSPQLVKVSVNTSEAFSTYKTCTVDWGAVHGYMGCVEGTDKLYAAPSSIGCSSNDMDP
ncbi:MAG: hypothetical protein IKK75_11620 [Clostridia bacterium]|nr:hypothetical protein [Clostridia bacterium]